MSHPKLWTKDFIIISCVKFFISLVFYLLIVIMSVYAVDEYQASLSQAGLVAGIFILGTLAGRIIISRYIDLIGRRKTLFIGLISNLFTTALYLIQYDINFLLVNRFLHGFTYGISSSAASIIAAQIIPETRKGEGIAYFSLSTILSAAIGPFIGTFMSQKTSFEMIFGLCIVQGIICLLIALFVYVPSLEIPKDKSIIKGFKLSDFIDSNAVPISVVTLILGFCYSSIFTFINLYALENNLVNSASFFFLIYSIAILISRPFTGPLMDVKGANYVMYPGFILFMLGMVLLSSVHNGYMLLISSFLIGLGFGNLQSCSQALTIKVVPQQRVGLATSTYFIFLEFGTGSSPFLLGLLIPFISYSELYAIISVVVLLCFVIYYFVHGRKEGSRLKATAK